MTRGLTTVEHDFADNANATVNGILAKRVAWMVDHPSFAIRALQRFGLDMLEPEAILARVEVLLEQARRERKGWMDFGREVDLLAIVEYARRMMEVVCHG